MRKKTPLLPAAGLVLLALLPVALVGCSGFGRWTGPRWRSDFDSAEADVRQSNKPLLIRYIDPKPTPSDPLDEAFTRKETEKRLRDFVCCRLFKPYEPDRRYVGQFGVQRAPAVIVVYPDETFQAHTGAMSAEELLAFLDQPPGTGQTVLRNPYIRREARFEWLGGFAEVADAVERTGKAGLVLVYRRFSPDFERLGAMLQTHEVFSRIGNMIHGRDGGWNRWARTRKTPVGEVKLPAIVLLQPGGLYNVLEMPNSSAVIARFTDRCLSSGVKKALPSMATSNATASHQVR